MGVLMRSDGCKWQSIAKVEFDSESQLQHMLYESPELVAEDGDPALVFTKEFGLPGGGSTDLIGVDATGRIVIVETKLARNAEIRRKVLGQVLEYAAYLWGMSFEQFDARFKKNEKQSVLDLLRAKDEEIERDELRSAISKSLESGTFDMMIAVDRINPELEKVIAFLSTRKNAVRMEALEFEAYKDGNVELLVPHRHGQIVVPPSESASTTLDEIIQACEDEHDRKLLRLLLDEWQLKGNLVLPRTKGVSCRAEIAGKEVTVFCAYTNLVEVWFQYLERNEGPPEAVLKYRKDVAALAGFKPNKVMRQSSPNARWSTLNEQTVLSFVSASQAFVELWRQAGQSRTAHTTEGSGQ